MWLVLLYFPEVVLTMSQFIQLASGRVQHQIPTAECGIQEVTLLSFHLYPPHMQKNLKELKLLCDKLYVYAVCTKEG